LRWVVGIRARSLMPASVEFGGKGERIFSFAASRNSARDNVFPVALSKIGTHTIFNLSGMPVFILPLGFEDLVKFLLKICAW